MSIKHLRTLVSVHDSGSFLTASRELNVTLSTVSMQMKGLERELGAELFDRSHRPPKLTQAGVRLVEPARNLVKEYDNLVRQARFDEPLSGPVEIGAISTTTISLLPNALRLMAVQYPTAQIRVRTALTDDLIENVLSGQLDAALVTQPVDPPDGLRVVTVYSEELVVAGPAHLADRLSLEGLDGTPFIRFVRRTGIGKIIDELLVRHGIRPDFRMEIDALEGILNMIASGLGASIVPYRSVAHAPAGEIFIGHITEEDVFRKVALVTRDRPETLSLNDALSRILLDASGSAQTP